MSFILGAVIGSVITYFGLNTDFGKDTIEKIKDMVPKLSKRGSE